MSEWQYKTDDGNRGPVSFKELAELVRAGRVTEGTQVCRAGTMNWEPAWRVPGLFRAAGILEPGDSPILGDRNQTSVVGQPALTPALSQGERGRSALGAALSRMETEKGPPLVTLANVVRGMVATVIGVLAVGFFYRWANEAALAFPMPPTIVDGDLIDCYFPLVGRCTKLECGLLYFDVFAVAALAAWCAVGKRLNHESRESHE